jgi:hypothetical protein
LDYWPTANFNQSDGPEPDGAFGPALVYSGAGNVLSSSASLS